MRKLEDLVGRRYGRLVVVKLLDSDVRGQRRWLCRCDCGGQRIATTGSLNAGRTTNCGCKKSPDLTGQVFGKLTVLGRSDKRTIRGKRTVPTWRCRCECGAIVDKATDVLMNDDVSMCLDCAKQYSTAIARKYAGFVDGTQVTKLRDMSPNVANSSGVRGVYFERKNNMWRARLTFKGKIMSFGSYMRFEDAVCARKEAEELYFGKFLQEYEEMKNDNG